MVVTTRRRAAAIQDSTIPEKESMIDMDTTSKHSTKGKKDQSHTVETPPQDTESEEHDSTDEDSNNDSDDQESSSDEEQDDDLDDLLDKAQNALRKQQDGVIKLESGQKTHMNLELPKLQPGVSIDDELYIKANEDGIAKLSSQTVAVVDHDESGLDTKNTKTLVALTKIKEESKPLSRKERQLEREKTAGKGWFDMPLADVTPEIKRDLQILRMRHVLDRKRHYKKMGKGPDPKYFQMGTIIEGATEFFSSRINKKDRKRTFAEEIMSNDDYSSYYNRKYQESQARKSSGGKKHYKKLKAKRS